MITGGRNPPVVEVGRVFGATDSKRKPEGAGPATEKKAFVPSMFFSIYKKQDWQVVEYQRRLH